MTIVADAAPPPSDPAVCWTCNGAADPKCAKRIVLDGIGSPGTRDPLGCAVEAKGRFEYVAVAIPRCRACLVGSRVREVSGLFACVTMIAVGVGFGLILSHVTGIDYDKLPGSEALPSLFVVGLGMMLGWVAGFYGTITIGCLILGATRKRPKADKHFPLIVALLARGWTWPSTSD